VRLADRVAALAVPVLAVPVLATGCTDAGLDETGTPLPVTGEALAVLAGDHVRLQLDSVWTPVRRPDSCRGVSANADFEGSRVALGLEIGDCPGRTRPAYVCAGDPVPLGQDGVAEPLEDCDREELDGGRVLYTGTIPGDEEPTYRAAVLYDRGLRYTVTTDERSDVRDRELAGMARDARVGATVDAAYVAAGRDLPRSHDH